MTRKLLFLSLIFLISYPAWSWDKSKFDINLKKESLALEKSIGIGYEGREIKNQVSEMTLIQGGYFTLGTNQGLSPTTLDDHCGITFGHPYALTSYPIISIDGNWGKLEKFIDIYRSKPVIQGDSLILTYDVPGTWQFNFSMKPNPTGENITIVSSLKNLDTQSHTFGMGLVLDPGLGKKGDGWVEIQTQNILRDTLLTGAEIPSPLLIKERSGKVDGMRLMVDFGSLLPDKLILANWKDIYQDDGPDFTYYLLRKMYDLALKIIWNGETIAPGSQITSSVILKLQQPDFNTPLFMRWDLPGFLSIENNLLFPRSFDSFIEITNSTPNAQSAVLNFNFPNELFSGTLQYPFNIPGNEIFYQRVKMQSKEIYEDKIIDLSVVLEHNGQPIDSMMRQVYIPAVPLSDTGLVCTIDTVITLEYPIIKFTFEAQVEATGQRLLNLSSENIFLYENDVRVKEFTMGKDTTGGVMAADIIFVLDVTGSMGGEIAHVRDNIIEFCDSLEARGVDYQLGMVTFLDAIENIYTFTDDPRLFKSYVAAQYAHEGGDGPENSLDALYRAAQFPFRPTSNRIFIWITDADYHEMDHVTPKNKQEVVEALLLHDVTVHAIGPTHFQTDWYNPVIEPTGGNFYDIYGNFRDILLDISRLRATSRFLISYTSPGVLSGSNRIKLEIHYAGLGGTGYAEYNYGALSTPLRKALTCYPNPFNPIVQISINLEEYDEGSVEIFNILGQRVRSFPLHSATRKNIILWDAKDNYNREVGMGTYFVRLNVFAKDRKLLINENTKILYLK